MAKPDEIRDVCNQYIAAVAAGDFDTTASLYADDATVEDPVGGEVHRGMDAIRGFCHAVKDGRTFEVGLMSLNVAGGEAAFHFQVTTDGRRMDVIDVMTFDDDAKITSMKAYWSFD